MIILDTNVLSALMQTDPPQVVIGWLDRQPRTSICTTAVTMFEIEHGLLRLPDGRKKKRLYKTYVKVMDTCLEGRCLSFDSRAAVEAGALAAQAEAQGRNIEIRDLQIAGIASAENAVVATRNTRHFKSTCSTVNPWKDA